MDEKLEEERLRKAQDELEQQKVKYLQQRRLLIEDRHYIEKMIKDSHKSKLEATKIRLVQEQRYLDKCRDEYLNDVERKKQKRREMREYLQLLKR